MWFSELVASPIFLSACFCITASSVSQSELELMENAHLIDRDQIVVVVEFFRGREVSVLLALEWHVRFRESRNQVPFLGLVLDDAPKDIFWKRPQFGCTLLSQLHEGQGLVVVWSGISAVYVYLFLLIAHLIIINLLI
jgi:hypothetical protein